MFNSKYRINKKWRVKRIEVGFSIRSSKCPFGRFGAGWNWKLGIQIGGRTILISLIIAELMLSIKKGESCK